MKTALACVLPLLMLAPAVAAPSAERERIHEARRQVEAKYSAEEAACREQFVVTACVEDVRARRRKELEALHRQDLQLDDAERKQRAAQRLQTIEDKRAEAASRPPAASQPEPVVRKPAFAASGARLEVRRPNVDGEAQDAAQRAEAAEKRRAEAAAERAKIEAREAERAQRNKKPDPLPLPPEVAASVQPR